ncbi:hypothetical protein HPB47_023206 [Ixodes persulcatus]|uniref:Uncharacterized protein n=1 Tax=Ixodes persulcatus TaxID=34615 RepID=A0AC60Q7M0_IXOPE|nr:hypothetical protein HPB47_023206 [Ixodes persulcatus]
MDSFVTARPRDTDPVIMYAKEIKAAELRLAAHVAVHGSFFAADHLAPLVSLTKSDLRNRLSHSTLESILFVKFRFLGKKECCKDFKPTEEFFVRFNSQVIRELECSLRFAPSPVSFPKKEASEIPSKVEPSN